jgi:hypothetical protein
VNEKQREILAELSRLGQEIGGPEMMVCVTHRRINVCRQGNREGGCVWSADPADLEGIGMTDERNIEDVLAEVADQAEQTRDRMTKMYRSKRPPEGDDEAEDIGKVPGE